MIIDALVPTFPSMPVCSTEQRPTRLVQPRADPRRISTVASKGKLIHGALTAAAKSALA